MREQSQKNFRETYSYCPRKITQNRLKILTKPSITEQPIQDFNPHKKLSIIQRNDPVYSISFGEHVLIIVTKTGVTIYSLLTRNIVYNRKGSFWDAKSIPSTNYLFCLLKDQENERDESAKKNRLSILDIDKDKFIGTVTLNFDIQQIKTAKKCIAAASPKQIAIMHFPSFKPICHEPAGNGLFNIFDLSNEGLTFAYEYVKRGCLIIHNYTNAQIARIQRKYSKSSMTFSEQASMRSQITKNKFNKNSAKNLIEVQAHRQRLKTIKISPNGLRIATSSYKGTVIRIFLANTGVIWQQLRVGYEICKLIDTSYSEEGNVLVCLNENNMVSLFNLKLQTNEEFYQSYNRGYKIYQQENPKSFFHFLSFLNRDLGYDHRFSYFKLSKPQEKQNEALKPQKNSTEKSQPLQSSYVSKIAQITPIKQQEGYMEVVLEEEDTRTGENQKLVKEKPLHIQQREQNSERKQSIRQEEFDKQAEKVAQIRKSALKRSISDMPARSTSMFFSKSKSVLPKGLSSKKAQDFTAKVYNTIGRVHVGGNNFIWAVKGHYIFMIKYDPFNGGQMHHRETTKFAQ